MNPTFEYSPDELTLFEECGALVEAESSTCPPVMIYATVLPAIILRHDITDWRRDAARRAMVAIELANPKRLTDEFDDLVAKPSSRLADALGVAVPGPEDPSYHDVEVFCDGTRYALTESYAIELCCTRAGGWSLWSGVGRGQTKLGEEFGNSPFEIRVNGSVICKSLGKAVNEGGDA